MNTIPNKILKIEVHLTGGDEGVAFVELSDRATAILDFEIDSFGIITLTKESEERSCFYDDNGNFLERNFLDVMEYINFEIELF